MKKVITKNSTYLFTFIIMFLSSGIYAQDWRVMMKDARYNVHDVQAAFYKWYAQQPHKDKVKSNEGDADAEEESNGAYTLFKRWEAFYVPRTYPSGNRPNPAVLEKEYNEFLATQNHKQHRAQAAGSSSNWTYIGNTGDANLAGVGRVNHVRFFPGNTNIIYACTPSGGLWKSVNAGSSWTTNTDNLIDISVDDIAINPLNTNIQYIAMGDGDGGYAGYTPSTVGVLKSTDGGNTWNPSGLYLQLPTTGPSVTTIQQLLINPVDTGVLFAASTSGLYYTSNGGLSWTNVIPNHDIRDVEFMAKHTDVVFASGFDGTFWRSTNYGTSFTQVTGGWSSSDRLEIGVTPADSEYIYILAGNAGNGGYDGVYLSTNGGTSFTAESTSSLSVNPLGWNSNGSDKGTGQGWYDLSIAVSPTNRDSLLIGGVNIWASANDGKSFGSKAITLWNNNPYVHADIHYICFAPGSGKHFITGCDGGVFSVALSGGTATPTDIGNNLGIAQQYGIGNSQQTSTEFITGWQDNGTNISAASSTAWSQVVGGDGTLCFIDYTNDQNQYASYPDGTLYASINGGGFNTITNGLPNSGPWIVPFLEDPKTPNTIYCGFTDVYQSTNQGGTWTQKSTWGSSASLNQIDAIAIDSSANTDVYAAGYSSSGSVIEFTSNITAGTPTWTNITSGLPSTSATISAIAVNPKNPAQVWVTFSGYSANAKVYYSANGNTATPTWTNLSAGLPNLPVNCILYESGTPDGIYIGMDGGVYYRDNTTSGWVNFSSGLPNVPVNQLAMYNATHTLRAATFGRGSWGTPHWTAPASKPVAMFTGYPLSYCVNDTVQFTDTSSGQPTSWSWTFQNGNPATSTAQNPVVVYNTAGTYSVSLTATNANGSNTLNQPAYITVNPDPPVPNITQSGQTLTCNTAATTYQWYYSGAPIANATASTYTGSPLPLGTYSVVITNSFGCTSSKGSFVVTSTTGISDLSSNDSFSIYPNPASGNATFTLNMPKDETYTISLSDVLGRTVYSDNIHISKTNYTGNINLSSYSKGIYFISVKGNGFSAVKKLIVY